jgi:hypothetical protein
MKTTDQSVMNIHEKMPIKMLANQIQQCIKLSMQYDQVELIPDMKSS